MTHGDKFVIAKGDSSVSIVDAEPATSLMPVTGDRMDLDGSWEPALEALEAP